MTSQDKFLLEVLKKEIAAIFLQEHVVSESIKEWKGEDIILFQEDLFYKVGAKVSEKWFYTYFKNDAKKLPRIDMLNLLSNYVGYTNWNAFKKANLNSRRPSKKFRTVWYLVIGVILFVMIQWIGFTHKNEFNFCFVDDIRNENILNTPISIEILNEIESPLYYKVDSLGCFSYATKGDHVTFIVRSPYYQTDTIVRYIGSIKNKSVFLRSDDYALMLQYFMDGNVKDWQKHKVHLQNMFAEDAVIYQLRNASVGVELYDKESFIRMLTLPTRRLNRLKILERTFEDGKIVTLKFMVL